MQQDDYGNAILDEEQFREHVLSDCSNLIERVGMYAFLNMLQDRVECSIELDNINRILEEW